MKAIICGGGTVGHITPGISIAEIILRDNEINEVLFVGRAGGEENDVIKKKGLKLRTIKISPPSRKIKISSLKSLVSIAKSIYEAKRILLYEKPDIVIGTGGYVCWPIIKSAQNLKIPTVLHESNLCPGSAVKFLSPKCDLVLLNFKNTERELKRKDNTVVVGNPLPDSFTQISREKARRKLNISKNEFFILSFGGSGGAEVINKSIMQLLKNYSAKNKDVRHVHATGRKYYEAIKEKYSEFENENNGCKIMPFIDNMALYMRAADTVISRCGAMTLSEIVCCEVVPILIPSPNVTSNHQYKNAKFFTDAGAALMIEESELNERTLLDAVRCLKSNIKLHGMMKRNICKMKTPDTKRLILASLENIIKK